MILTEEKFENGGHLKQETSNAIDELARKFKEWRGSRRQRKGPDPCDSCDLTVDKSHESQVPAPFTAPFIFSNRHISSLTWAETNELKIMLQPSLKFQKHLVSLFSFWRSIS